MQGEKLSPVLLQPVEEKSFLIVGVKCHRFCRHQDGTKLAVAYVLDVAIGAAWEIVSVDTISASAGEDPVWMLTEYLSKCR